MENVSSELQWFGYVVVRVDFGLCGCLLFFGNWVFFGGFIFSYWHSCNEMKTFFYKSQAASLDMCITWVVFGQGRGLNFNRDGSSSIFYKIDIKQNSVLDKVKFHSFHWTKTGFHGTGQKKIENITLLNKNLFFVSLVHYTNLFLNSAYAGLLISFVLFQFIQVLSGKISFFWMNGMEWTLKFKSGPVCLNWA